MTCSMHRHDVISHPGTRRAFNADHRRRIIAAAQEAQDRAERGEGTDTDRLFLSHTNTTDTLEGRY